MSVSIQELVQRSYGAEAAKEFAGFEPDTRAIERLVEEGINVLAAFPPGPLACVPVSALWTAVIRDHSDYPVHMFAGDLVVHGHYAFESRLAFPVSVPLFSASNPDWPGHTWLMFGDRIADASLFRTAYAQPDQSRLRRAVVQEFGMGRGLLVSTSDDLSGSGFEYVPKYAVTDDELTALVRGARVAIEKGH